MTQPAPGRPRAASRELFQEAAFELFQLHGYRNTSVEQIAKTAGFSRATFFNFFSSKSELFWLETDALIARLSACLRAELESGKPASLGAVIDRFATTVTSADIPWALQNFRLLRATDDLVASGAGRVMDLNGEFRQYLEKSAAQGDGASAAARGAVQTALLLTALFEWIDAGVGRGSLRDYLS